MAQTNEHGRIIAAAANAALAPIGCVRKGQSRIWRSDHRYWAIDVEFQPSGWQKGSYLNIFVAWLWNVTDGYNLFDAEKTLGLAKRQRLDRGRGEK